MLCRSPAHSLTSYSDPHPIVGAIGVDLIDRLQSPDSPFPPPLVAEGYLSDQALLIGASSRSPNAN
jgi:hypothetical protein